MISANLELPLFVYGALKPGEISFPMIKDSVEGAPLYGYLDGFELLIVDGIPIARKNKKKQIAGYLISLTNKQSVFEKIEKFEGVPVGHYEWQEAAFRIAEPVETEEDVPAKANILVATGSLATRFEKGLTDWDSGMDPFFGGLIDYSFTRISSLVSTCESSIASDCNSISNIQLVNIKGPDNPGDARADKNHWDVYLELQSDFGLLWTLLERTYLFRHGPRPTEVIDGKRGPKEIPIPWWQAWDELKPIPEWQNAISEADINSEISCLSNQDPYSEALRTPKTVGNWPFAGWYQLRNNAIHRGKGATHLELADLCEVVIDLHNTLAALLPQLTTSIVDKWKKLQSANPPCEHRSMIQRAEGLFQIDKTAFQLESLRTRGN